MAPSYTPLDEQTYLMHRLAVEGGIFYNDNLTEKAHVKTYFPPGEDQQDYEQAPKISYPITAEVIDRLGAIIHHDMEITCKNTAVQEKLTKIQKRNDWKELERDLFINSMSGGNLLVVLRADWDKDDKPAITLETWPGEFVFKIGSGDWTTLGYMYLWKDGKMQPITSEPEEKDFKEKRVIIAYINEESFSWYGDPQPYEHDFGFMPAVLFRAVDKIANNRYGKPYHMRFRDLNIEYNLLGSQASKDLRILRNVWVSNLDAVDPNKKVRIQPDKVMMLGADGYLKQAANELNLDSLHNKMDRLKAHIAARAQVPDFMTGLRDVGKVESGIALSITVMPLIELVGRVVEYIKPKYIEVMDKAARGEFALEGKRPPAFELDCVMNPVVIPIDKQREIDNLGVGVDKAIITPDEARQRYIQLMELDYLLEEAN